PHDQIMTPWDRLQSIPNYSDHLKPGITIATLERKANAMSDNEAAMQLQQARKRLFQSINRRSKLAA
ncbi:MAG: integrase, partial [Casimicrobiaceae bacterium]